MALRTATPINVNLNVPESKTRMPSYCSARRRASTKSASGLQIRIGTSFALRLQRLLSLNVVLLLVFISVALWFLIAAPEAIRIL